MKTAAALFAVLILAGCANSEQVIKTVTVDVPVPVHCKPDVDPGASWKDDTGVEHLGYPDTAAALKAAPDLYVRVKLLLVGRSMRIQREAELSAALKGCE